MAQATLKLSGVNDLCVGKMAGTCLAGDDFTTEDSPLHFVFL
jgi:hypothetical protein